ncbi:MAG: hypothetical protein V1791_04205 [Pseudomonadota bacterium]
MAEQTDKENAFSIEDLVISHSYEMLALITVLEKKGILNRAELISVIDQLKNSE